MFTSSTSAWACRIAALIYLLFFAGAMLFVREYNARNATAVGIVALMGMGCLVGALILWKCAREHDEALRSANRKAQQLAYETEYMARMEKQAEAYYLFVGFGLSDELAVKLAEHDVYTLDAAWAIEREYKDRGAMYNAELRFIVDCQDMALEDAEDAAEQRRAEAEANSIENLLCSNNLTPAQEARLADWEAHMLNEQGYGEVVTGSAELRDIEHEFNQRHREYVLAGGTAGAAYVYDDNRMPWDQD